MSANNGAQTSDPLPPALRDYKAIRHPNGIIVGKATSRTTAFEGELIFCLGGWYRPKDKEIFRLLYDMMLTNASETALWQCISDNQIQPISAGTPHSPIAS